MTGPPSTARPAFRRWKDQLRQCAIALCRGGLRLTSQPYVPPGGTTVVFAPHQDDETLGCGGLIARKRVEGLSVHVIFITDGSGSHPRHSRVTPKQLAAIRQQEAHEALGLLGVDSASIHFLNEVDGTLSRLTAGRREPLIGRISELLRELRPSEIFLPCHADASSEHDAAFVFVIEALRQTGLFPTVWQYPVWAWWNPMVLLERLIFSSGHCRVPTEDYRISKNRALSRYRSQIEPLAPDIESSLPRNFIRIFDSDTEFFLRFNLGTDPFSGSDPRRIVI